MLTLAVKATKYYTHEIMLVLPHNATESSINVDQWVTSNLWWKIKLQATAMLVGDIKSLLHSTDWQMTQ